MKRLVTVFLALIMCCTTFCGCSNNNNTALTKESFKEKWEVNLNANDVKVIIDADVTYLNDDMLAIFSATQAHKLSYIDLLGITVTGGNSYVACGVYDLLTQLEYIGMGDIPVYAGREQPLNGFIDVEKFKKQAGDIGYYGCYSCEKNTDDYLKAKTEGSATSPLPTPKIAMQQQSSVDFIIEQAHKYEGKLTLIALGGLMNIALAVQKDPTVVDCISQIIIMGGVFDARAENCPGIEFNFWYDPVATNICLSQNWKKQIIVSHDAATTCLKDKDVYNKYKAKNNTKITKLLVEDLAHIYENGLSESTTFCWDLLTIIYLLHPEIVTNIDSRYVYVDEREGLTYGKTYNWIEGQQPENMQIKSDIILGVKGNTVWDFVTDLYSINI